MTSKEFKKTLRDQTKKFNNDYGSKFQLEIIETKTYFYVYIKLFSFCTPIYMADYYKKKIEQTKKLNFYDYLKGFICNYGGGFIDDFKI